MMKFRFEKMDEATEKAQDRLCADAMGDAIYGGDGVSRVVYVEANMKVTSRSGGLDKNQDIDGANSRTKGDK
jgi:hypothetical protein